MFIIRNIIDSVFFLLSTDVIWRIQLLCVDVEWWWRDITIRFKKRDGMCRMEEEVEFWDI